MLREQTQVPKKILEGYLFAFVKYHYSRIPKMRAKYFKNYVSILVIVKHQNWLDDSPHLIMRSNTFSIAFKRFDVYLFHHQ